MRRRQHDHRCIDQPELALQQPDRLVEGRRWRDYFCASNAGKLYAFSYAHGQTRTVKYWMFTALPPDAGLSNYTFDNAGLSFATWSTYPDAAGTGTDGGSQFFAR